MPDLGELRKALGCFITGVTVVTTRDGNGEQRGFTANSFTSVSLDPPLVLVCLSRKASSFAAFAETGYFAVNVLAEDQKEVSSAFASKLQNKFSGMSFRRGTEGAPILEGAAAWLDCSTHRRIDCGDHIILVGRVHDFGSSEVSPLGFYRGNYFTFRQQRDAADAAHEYSGTVGGIFEKDRSILLVKQNGLFSLPVAPTLGERTAESGSLFDILRKAGVTVAIEFVFSIAHEDGDARAGVYYRGQITSGPANNDSTIILIPIDKIPWDSIKSLNQRTMLTRYIRERTESRFGIYVGTAAGGAIKGLKVD
jgi:flavin reductase (DIM6/NTAB) family NADH-FMN oxidoreductase RutF